MRAGETTFVKVLVEADIGMVGHAGIYQVDESGTDARAAMHGP